MSFSDWELLDDGSFNGVAKWIRSSDEDHGTVQVRYDDLGSRFILDENKWAQNHAPINKRSDMWHVASIPAAVQLEWLNKYGVDPWKPEHEKARRKLLNDPEYNYLKRAPIVI